MTEQIKPTLTVGEGEMSRYVRIEEIQRRFSLSRSTVHRLLRDGKIRSCSLQITGKQARARLIDAVSVATFIESEIQRQDAANEARRSPTTDNNSQLH